MLIPPQPPEGGYRTDGALRSARARIRGAFIIDSFSGHFWGKFITFFFDLEGIEGADFSGKPLPQRDSFVLLYFKSDLTMHTPYSAPP